MMSNMTEQHTGDMTPVPLTATRGSPATNSKLVTISTNQISEQGRTQHPSSQAMSVD